MVSESVLCLLSKWTGCENAVTPPDPQVSSGGVLYSARLGQRLPALRTHVAAGRNDGRRFVMG